MHITFHLFMLLKLIGTTQFRKQLCNSSTKGGIQKNVHNFIWSENLKKILHEEEEKLKHGRNYIHIWSDKQRLWYQNENP